MSVVRVFKDKNYTVMSNHHLRERKMSLKAKGLLSVMLSLPEDWDYSINGLVSICKESELAVKNALKELKEFGYLEVVKLMPNETDSGRLEYVYNIYEKPVNTTQKQEVENQPLEMQEVEKQGQLNTNKQNTKELNTKDIYIGAKRPSRSKFTKPTLEEVKAYCDERHNNINPEQFIDYYEARGWELSKGRKMKDWKACIRTWEKNGYNNKPKKNNTSEVGNGKKNVNNNLSDFYAMAKIWAEEEKEKYIRGANE